MTVSDLILLLKTFPPSKLIAIEDADTYWHGDKIHIREYENVVYLKIEYHEMTSGFDAGEPVKKD